MRKTRMQTLHMMAMMTQIQKNSRREYQKNAGK